MFPVAQSANRRAEWTAALIGNYAHRAAVWGTPVAGRPPERYLTAALSTQRPLLMSDARAELRYRNTPQTNGNGGLDGSLRK
jgi:hypothetical protein